MQYTFDKDGVLSKSVFPETPGVGVQIPTNGVELEELPVKEGYVWLYNNGEVTQTKDNRGVYYLKETGEAVEYKELGDIPNTLTKKAPTSPYDKWDGKKWVKDDEKEFKDQVPVSLSRFQAITMLRLTKVPGSEITLYKATSEYLESLSDDSIENITAKTAWENAQEFKRDSALISMAQIKFGLTERQVDEMFIQGEKIEA